MLVQVYLQQLPDVKPEPGVKLEAEPALDVLSSADASFLLGHLSVLFGLLMHGSAENQRVILQRLRVEGMVEHAAELAAFYAVIRGGEESKRGGGEGAYCVFEGAGGWGSDEILYDFFWDHWRMDLIVKNSSNRETTVSFRRQQTCKTMISTGHYCVLYRVGIARPKYGHATYTSNALALALGALGRGAAIIGVPAEAPGRPSTGSKQEARH